MARATMAISSHSRYYPRLARAYRTGMSMASIAKAIGRSEKWVRLILKDIARPPGRPRSVDTYDALRMRHYRERKKNGQ